MGTAKSRQFKDVRHEYLKGAASARLFAVMHEGGGIPTVLHPTFDGAAYEAARLAHENPGCRFHVLSSKRVSVAEAAESLAVPA